MNLDEILKGLFDDASLQLLLLYSFTAISFVFWNIFLIFFRGANARSPIGMIMSILERTLSERANLDLIDRLTLANQTDITNLRVAQKYFELVSKEILEESPTRFSRIEAQERDVSPETQVRFAQFQRISDFLDDVLPVILITLVIGIAVICIVELLKYLATLSLDAILAALVSFLSGEVLYVAGFAVLFVLAQRLFGGAIGSFVNRFLGSEPVFEYAYGRLGMDRFTLSVENIAERQNQIAAVLSEINRTESTQVELAPDPDLQPIQLRDSLAVPGLTETILSHDQDGILEMRRRLNAVGLFHWRFAIATVVAFFLAFGVSVYAAVFMGSKAYSMMFGGAGIGIVLGVFAFLLLKNVRTANIAIALFDSYLIELRSRLETASKIADTAQAEKDKAKAWLAFRTGLNALWKMERAEKPPAKSKA